MRQISFADWELMRQGDRGVRLEPLLEAISAFLDDQRDVIECIRRDLVRGLKQPGSGRNGLSSRVGTYRVLIGIAEEVVANARGA